MSSITTRTFLVRLSFSMANTTLTIMPSPSLWPVWQIIPFAAALLMPLNRPRLSMLAVGLGKGNARQARASAHTRLLLGILFYDPTEFFYAWLSLGQFMSALETPSVLLLPYIEAISVTCICPAPVSTQNTALPSSFSLHLASFVTWTLSSDVGTDTFAFSFISPMQTSIAAQAPNATLSAASLVGRPVWPSRPLWP